MDNTFSYKVTYHVNDYDARVMTMCHSLNKALEVLRKMPTGNGILTIHTVHTMYGVSKGGTYSFKSFAYINGRLKTLNNNTVVMGNNYTAKSYSAKIMR